VFKTPTATLVAILVAIVGALSRKRQTNRFDGWTVMCLSLSPVLYASSAMAANLNLGLRHFLPVYPFIFVALGVAMAWIIQRRQKIGAVIAAILVIGLAVESLHAYPNFIPFFNTVSGGPDNGINLLGDSNLDWGQDLKLLANWRKDHHEKPMYLAYFGIADPNYYGLDAIDLPRDAGGWPFAKNPKLPAAPCYFAISATNLQCIYVDNRAAAQYYQQLRHENPLVVFGHSIYVFELRRR